MIPSPRAVREDTALTPAPLGDPRVVDEAALVRYMAASWLTRCPQRWWVDPRGGMITRYPATGPNPPDGAMRLFMEKPPSRRGDFEDARRYLADDVVAPLRKWGYMPPQIPAHDDDDLVFDSARAALAWHVRHRDPAPKALHISDDTPSTYRGVKGDVAYCRALMAAVVEAATDRLRRRVGDGMKDTRESLLAPNLAMADLASDGDLGLKIEDVKRGVDAARLAAARPSGTTVAEWTTWYRGIDERVARGLIDKFLVELSREIWGRGMVRVIGR